MGTLRPRRWIVILAVVLLASVALLMFEPTQTVPALLRGEPFFRCRSLSYWREVLRTDGEAKDISESTLHAFRGQPYAVPVLLACMNDQDPNVRWRAIHLLGRRGANADQVVPALRKALHDEQLEVRLQALLALGRMGGYAHSAANDLYKLSRDADAQVAFVANGALWKIDPVRARKVHNWSEFKSPEWGFSATFPGVPEQPATPPPGEAIIAVRAFETTHMAMHCGVTVCEYADDYVKSGTEDERLKASQDGVALSLGGTVRSECQMMLQGRTGREFIIEVPVHGAEVRFRLFWDRRRLYQAGVGYKRGLMVPEAAEFFLNSFRFEP